MQKGKLSGERQKLIGPIVLEACVFGLSSWIVARFFPNEKVIHDAILISLIFAVGITIMLRGNATRNRALNTLGFLIFLVGVFVVIYKYEEFAVKISAFGVLLVAFAAFASIEESRRIRQDSIEREGRDRKERLFDEVAKWLRELEGRIFPRLSEFYSGIEDKIMTMTRLEIHPADWLQLKALNIVMDEMHDVDEGIKEAEYYRKLTLKLDEELSSLIEVVVRKLEERRQLHVEAAELGFNYGVRGKVAEFLQDLVEKDDKPLEGLGLSEHDILAVRFGRNAYAVSKSIVNAVDRVIEIRTSLIEIS